MQLQVLATETYKAQQGQLNKNNNNMMYKSKQNQSEDQHRHAPDHSRTDRAKLEIHT
jgi:hypothetical protein